jgi:small subunit ribosomal protein S20
MRGASRSGDGFVTSGNSPLVHSPAVANIQSQIKRNRQNERRRVRNKSIRTALKTSQKKVRVAAAEGDLETAATQSREAAQALDKAVSKGAMHKRAAARRKSRMAKSVARASGSASSQAS